MSIPNKKNTGFTLVEMLIIAPLAIILVGGLIAAIVALTSKVMITQARNDLTYASNNALSQIETDTQSSLSFMADSGTIAAPQGSGGTPTYTGSGKFLATNNHLILEMMATDRNPLNPDKQIVRYKDSPNPCGANESLNTPMTVKVIYFVNSDKQLFRRVVSPELLGTDNTCEDSWQVNTCTNGFSGGSSGTVCGAKDELMATGVTKLNVDYYADPSSTTTLAKSAASSAKGIEVTIDSSRDTAGETIKASYSIRANLYKH